jgi:hypothetical protein
MTYSITGAASIAFSRLGMKTRLSGTVSASVLTWDAFVGHDLTLAMYLNLWSHVSNYVASAKQTQFVIFYLNSDGCNPYATCEPL